MIGDDIFVESEIELENNKDVTFNATITIKELYNVKGVEIPVEKWKNHDSEKNTNLNNILLNTVQRK